MKRTKFVNYYELLGTAETASQKDIASAYRNKALLLHPDKNVDRPEIVSRFHELQHAYQILADPEKRKAFDEELASRSARRARETELDGARLAMQQDLLKREAAAQREESTKKSIALKLAQEKDQMRRNVLQRQKDEDDAAQRPKQLLYDDLDRTLRIWGFSSCSAVEEAFSPFGQLEAVAAKSSKKQGAHFVVMFAKVHMARAAMDAYEQKQLSDTVKIEWAKGRPPFLDEGKTLNSSILQSMTNPKDFESLTLMKMKRQAERQRIVKELLEQESKDSV